MREIGVETSFRGSFCDERKKKIVPGSLMKALMRPGGGDSRPSDGDQVTLSSCYDLVCLIVCFYVLNFDWYNMKE